MWLFNGTLILSMTTKYTVDEGSLIVHTVTGDDEGLYICVAINVHGINAAFTFLQPLCKYQLMYKILLQHTVKYIVGFLCIKIHST